VLRRFSAVLDRSVGEGLNVTGPLGEIDLRVTRRASVRTASRRPALCLSRATPLERGSDDRNSVLHLGAGCVLHAASVVT